MHMQPTRDPQIINLIYAVRRQAALYDYRLPGYHDEALKKRIWQEIAVECGMESDIEAQTYWKKLHHNFTVFYRNELIRLVRANYDESVIGPLPQEVRSDNTDHRLGNKTWSYYSDMRFIAPFRIKGTDRELERLIELAKPIVLQSSSTVKSSTHNAVTSATLTTRNARAAPTTTVTSTTASDTSLQTETLHLDVPPLSSEELAEENGSLSSFFDAMLRATRALPAQLQRRVKRELLQSVHRAEAEMEQMEEGN